MEELMQEIDIDPEIRKKVNLYKDQETIDNIKQRRKEKYKTKGELQARIAQLKA